MFVGQDRTRNASIKALEDSSRRMADVRSGRAGPLVPQGRSAAQIALERRIATTRNISSGAGRIPYERTPGAKSRAVTERALQMNAEFRRSLGSGG